MTEWFPLAFVMGLLGSMHCAVMCGPIVLSLPLKNSGFLYNGFQLLLYQFGRILVYTLMGFALGAVGGSFSLFSNQRMLSFSIGIILILFTFLQLTGKYQKGLARIQHQLINPISKLMGKAMNTPFWGFLIGMLNGLIPCGMVYLALATALNMGSIQSGGKFMFLFGLGTVPLMLAVSLGGIYLRKYIHFNTNRLVPWFMLFIGVLFILRAADLGIPFLSPDNMHQASGAVECK
ncbi:sulfite exporter TauE/SafE family protein [Pedobacter sp. MC2016-05]|uniref:sulfite exporter TauE/SafE family protein n=1 Tax=Pedobacter sp. MC2016-05 TaxID=2994474 RepID=UPI002245F88B|nr:sulfite exporter TauE/SafE family protein [Pedobacter sp. MC2016-05]MCX2477229.1 sulfite exporter TauE/SafE family protein [Pedobacter sp. MC2016-05]